jgi:DNA-binding NtrC family response regulator
MLEVDLMSPKLNIEIIPLSEVPSDESDLVAEELRHVVLIVDDEKVIADTLSIIVARSGYTVMTAYDGKTALELARVIPPELLITDVVMPGMTGIELAIALVAATPDCKVLLFSGQAATRDLLEKARDKGHDFAIVSKPIHPSDMLKRVRESLEMRETVRVLSAGQVWDGVSTPTGD